MRQLKNVPLIIVMFLALLSQAWAANYYVNSAADAGGDGTTQALTGANCAFKTISQVNAASFSGDDIISFNKGDTWREQLTVPSSGTSGHPITFNTYGNGAAPIIAGSELASVAGDWTQESAASSYWSSGFETNDFTEWTSKSGAQLTVSTTQAHGGTHSAHWGNVATGDQSMTKNLSVDQSSATFSFWIYHNSTVLIEPVIGYNTGITGAFQVQWTYGSGNIQARLVGYYDDASTDTTSYYTVQSGASPGWHKVEVVIVTGASGNFTLKIDGVAKQTTKTAATSTSSILHRIYCNGWNSSLDVYIDDIDVSVGSGDTNLWYHTCSAAPNVVWKNGSRMTKTTTKTDLSTDTGTTKWYWDAGNNRLYVYGGGSAPSGSFEIAQRDYAISATDKGYITIDGLQLQYANSHLARFVRSSGTLPYVTVQNCTINGSYGHGCDAFGSFSEDNYIPNFSFINNTVSDFGGNTSSDNVGLRLYGGGAFDIHGNHITFADLANNNYGSGISVAWTPTSDTDCKIYSNTIDGTLSTGNSAGIGSTHASYIDIYSNTITANANVGIWFDESNTDANDGPDHCSIYGNNITLGAYSAYALHIERSQNNSIYYNILDLKSSTNGNKVVWFARNAQSNTLYNNTLIVPNGVQAVQLGWASDPAGNDQRNCVIKNNIFYRISGTTGAFIVCANEGAAITTGIVFDNNLYSDPDWTGIISWFGTSYNSVSAWNTAVSSQEGNYQSGDPLFVNYVGGNYHVQAVSPCINAGIDVGLTTDFVGMPVPIGTAPDIGAYEWFSGGGLGLGIGVGGGQMPPWMRKKGK